MDEKEFDNVYAIPANYTDRGKLFGRMLETRNTLEAVLLLMAVGYPEIHLPIGLTAKIVLMTVTLVPLLIVALMNAHFLAAACETLTPQARDLPAHTGKIAARQMMREQIRDLFPITIRMYSDENMLAFSIPALLSKKEKGSALYIRLSLYAAFTNYFRNRPLLRIDNCVIVIRHRYEATRPEREYRDHENIELNGIIDTIAVFTLVDDAPLRCDHYYCSAPAERNATEVFLIPRERFSCWFDGERKMEL